MTVQEAISNLRAYAKGYAGNILGMCALAADLLESNVPRWISVEERHPENDEPVLVSAEMQGLNGKVYNVVFTAFHTDGTTHTEESGYTWNNCYDLGFKYCEDTDDYLIPEAWWEDVRYGEEYAMIPDYVNITHWMPLPESTKG